MSGVELTVTVQDKKTVFVRIDSGDAERCEVEHEPLYLETIRIFEDLLNQSKVSKRRELEVLGKHLYRMLFYKRVEALFEQALERLTKGDRLRVQLNFQKGTADDLASLPWEYLYCPDTENRPGFFFSTDTELVLSRYMHLPIDRQTLALEGNTLRILIVASEPKDEKLGPVLADPVIEAIENLKKKIEQRNTENLMSIEINLLNKPTVENFINKLEEIQPHILHFIGHGHFNEKEKRGEIALLALDETSVRWVEDKDFTQYFVQMDAKPNLVFLHLCEGAVVDLEANFAGLAPQLIRAGIPAVLAMQHPITNLAAIAFSQAFYDELAKGKSIGHAVQVGRYKITNIDPKLCNIRAFGTPVLYMRSRDGGIQQWVTEEAKQTPAQKEMVRRAIDLRKPGLKQDASAESRQPEPAPAQPAIDSFDPKEGEQEGETKKLQRRLASIFLEAQSSVNQMNRSDAEKKAMKARLNAVRMDLRDKTLDECREVLTDNWDREPDDNLKEIWLALVEKTK